MSQDQQPEFKDMTFDERIAYFRETMPPEMFKEVMRQAAIQRKKRERREYKRQQKEREVWGN